MVLRADDRLVPKFLEALEENGQPFLADKLREPGDLCFDKPQSGGWLHGGERARRGTERTYIGVKDHTEAKQVKGPMN